VGGDQTFARGLHVADDGQKGFALTREQLKQFALESMIPERLSREMIEINRSRIG